ncbi:MAG: hypothetical protein GY953_10470 [bacterium]|nr:hypothetical protein [bacterium]
MTGIAIGNFASVDRILEEPAQPAQEYIKVLGNESARTLMRHLASEQNRHYFSNWELAQLGLGAGLLAAVIISDSHNRLLLAGAVLMTLMVVVEHWLLTPYLTMWGRAIDFIPPEAPSPERYKFWRFNSAYTAIDIGKMVVGLGLSVKLLIYRPKRRSGKSRKNVDVIDDADNG